MKDIKKVFRDIEEKLQSLNWFNDGWHIYNQGDYLQVYKDNWFNENQGGIHFETYIQKPQIKVKSFPICMHVEEDCPSQQAFIQKFIELEGRQIKKWKGYELIGKGYNVCKRTMPLNFKNLDQRVIEELSRLQQLATSIDRVLDSL